MKHIKLFENFENDAPESKFNIGDIVYYIPELSGLHKQQPFIIKDKRYEKPEALLGEETKLDWYYSFEDSSLNACECDLSADVPRNEVR